MTGLLMGDRRRFLGSAALAGVLDDYSFTCLDIGARGGVIADLLPLAPWANVCGFEPDVGECERLNEEARRSPGPWRSLRYVPVGLGTGGRRTLRLYRQRGCSSTIEVDAELVDAFSRADDYTLDDTLEIETEPLDAVSESHRLEDSVYIKLDIEGAELDVLRSAERLLASSVLAIRVEVAFMPVHRGQPQFSDVESFVRGFGFVPMGFAELHHWRRTTRRKLPRLDGGPLPYSRGQLVHGDVIYFRDPSSVPEGPAAVKAAFLALAHGYVDHALALMRRPALYGEIQSRHSIDLEAAVSLASRHLARRHFARRLGRWASGLKTIVRDSPAVF